MKLFRFIEIDDLTLNINRKIFDFTDLVQVLNQYFNDLNSLANIQDIVILPSLLADFEVTIKDYLIEQAHFDEFSFEFIDWLDNCHFYCRFRENYECVLSA